MRNIVHSLLNAVLGNHMTLFPHYLDEKIYRVIGEWKGYVFVLENVREALSLHLGGAPLSRRI